MATLVPGLAAGVVVAIFGFITLKNSKVKTINVDDNLHSGN